MNNIPNHIKKAAESVRLSEAEHRHMSHVIHEYMAHKPIARGEYSSVSIQWFSFSWAYRSLPAVRQGLAAALALVFIFGGGISYAAEGALPGDALYTIKTKINEPVKVALATDAEAKAEVQMELAERRIEEAAALAAEDRLDIKTQTTLTAAFESHAQSATDEVETIDEEDSSAAAEITSRFETRLAAHEAVLSLVSEADTTNVLASAIRGTGLAVADIRARAEERMAVSAPITIATMSLMMDATPAADTTAMKAAPEAREVQVSVATTEEAAVQYDTRAAARMRTSAEAQLKAAQKKLKSIKISGEAKAKAEADLALADDRIEEGREFLKDGAAAQAYHAFQESLVISEKLNVMLKSESALKKASSRNADFGNNARAKVQDARDRARSSSAVRVDANLKATATPVHIDVDADADAIIQEILPVIPPSLKIFKSKENNDDNEEKDGEHKDEREEDSGLINIGF